MPPLRRLSVYLTDEDAAYLRAWDDANGSERLRRLIERARAMWPGGPSTNPLTARRHQHTTPNQEGTP
jgi:hypothetical protein